MIDIIRLFKTEVPKPPMFGWYHLMWLGILLVECILICIFRKKLSRKSVNIILLVIGSCLLLLETMKQIERSLSIGDAGNIIWHYPPSDFPFQLCSIPMYLSFLAGVLRKGKVYDCLMSYLATYGLFAGAIVMICPSGVFNTNNQFILIHTMIWHTSLFAMGLLILVTRSVELRIKTVLKGAIVFVVTLITAILMNVFAHLIVPDEYFNMFYIGPYFPNNFPVLEDIYAKIPWVVFLLVYTIGFFVANTLILLIAILTDKLARKIRERKAA